MVQNLPKYTFLHPTELLAVFKHGVRTRIQPFVPLYLFYLGFIRLFHIALKEAHQTR